MKRAALFALAFPLLAACGSRVDIADTGGSPGTSTHGTGGVGASGPSSSGFAGFAGSGAGSGTSSGFAGFGGAGAGSGTSSGFAGFGGAGASGGFAGFGGAGASGGFAGAGGSPVCPGFGDACTNCLSTACPSTYCACEMSSDCLALSACYKNCGSNAACQQTCQTAHQNGISELYALSDCAANLCPSECPGNKPIGDCTKCAVDTCPDALDACLAQPECVQLYQCLAACGNVNLTCQQGCYAQHGGGTMTLQALLMCETEPCGPVCQ